MRKTNGGKGPGRLVLEPRLDVAACAGLNDAIAAARGKPLALDAGKVTFLGGLALDLILRARAEWRAAGHDFAVTAPSDDFYESLSVLGIAPDILIPAAEVSA